MVYSRLLVFISDELAKDEGEREYEQIAESLDY